MVAPITRMRRLPVHDHGLIGLTAVITCSAYLVFVLQPFGHRGWALAVVSVLLVATAVPRSPVRRLSRMTRQGMAGVLGGWLALIAWSAATPGGPMPAPKTAPAAIRVLTWNVLVGKESGVPWSRHDWPVRKQALRSAIQSAQPDILCVQEALEGQVKYIEAALPGFRRVGAGRDDGRTAGEHCAIYFAGDRFEPLGEGTFWLEDPADQPPAPRTMGPKRICTWVRLRDQLSGRTVRVYNTHLYLTEPARLRAAHILLARIAAGDPDDAVLVAGDFNAAPGAPSRQIFAEAGLTSVTEADRQHAAAPTYQFYGIRWRCLDAIFLSPECRRLGHSVVDTKPDNTFPSDHFGILADFSLPGPPGEASSHQSSSME